MEREVSHSLVGRKCKFFQRVINCDSRFGKAVQVTVSPVSCPVLCFGLKGWCVLQVWRDKKLQLCTVSKRFDLTELGFCPVEPELIIHQHSLLPGAWELWRELVWRHRREPKPHPMVCRVKGGSATAEGETGPQLVASDTWNKIWDWKCFHFQV